MKTQNKFLYIKKEMLLWGSGKASEAAIITFLSTFLLYFYNQVMGLNAYFAGIALAITLIIDAISDPLIGLGSDVVFRSGKHRSNLIFASILPTFFFFLVLFLLPANSSQLILFLHLVIFASLLRLSLSFYSIPREAIGVQIFQTYEDRNKLWAINSFFNLCGISLSLGPTLLFFLSDWNNRQGYTFAALWISLVFIIFSVISSLSVRTIEKKINNSVLSQKHLYQLDFKTELRSLIKNRSWVALFIGCCLFSIQFGISSGTTLYFNNFLWYWEPTDIFWCGIFSLPGSIMGVLLIVFSNQKNKKLSAIFYGISATVVSPSLIFLRFLELNNGYNLIPEVGKGLFSHLWWWWTFQQTLENFLWTIFWILIASMFSDIIEEMEVSSGKRSDGFVLSANNFVNKLILSGGAIFNGLVLSFAGFNEAGNVVEQELAIQKLSILIMSSVVVFFPVALFFISKYKITMRQHEENLRALS